MNVIIACEHSGRVRDAFLARGHFAVSCDLLPGEGDSHTVSEQHHQGDVLELIREPWLTLPGGRGHCGNWDMMIAFPPCTHLAVSGARWFESKRVEQNKAIWFFLELARCDIPRIVIENPIGIMSTHYRKPDQIIQPWQFGHGETKATCLWLKNLPLLQPTNIVSGREARVHRMPPSKDRAKLRGITYQGVADAMAAQWGAV